MATTSLKLPDALRKRVARLSKRGGVSPHAFMVRAIEAAAAAEEQRRAFVDDALEAEAEMEASGAGYAMADVHAWLRARVAGKRVARPKARSWR